MPVHNADIAAIFAEIADLLEIQGANPFRVRAYRNAARSVEGHGRELRPMVEKGEDVKDIPGIGEDLEAKIIEIVTTGKCKFLERLHQELPPAITELLKIPGLGPKRVKALHHDLEVQTLEQLYRAAKDGRIRSVPGFGEKTETTILEAIEAHVAETPRFKLAIAAQYADALLAHLQSVRGVGHAVVAGSFRRMKETVGDLDLLVTAADSAPVMERFTGYHEVREVLGSGPTRSSVRLRSGLQVDLRVVPEESFGAALHYFTGSKAHNIAVRRLGQQRGLKINEYGVFSGDSRIAGATEASVFESVGLPWIPPELREDHGEIEAAQAGKLPTLIELADLKGDLHGHTKATDGRNTLGEMALAAKAAGLSYFAITEHSRRLTVARGLDPQRLMKQCAEIDRLNEKLAGITLLKGIEVDVLEDGSLDLPDSALESLDVMVAAIHSKFDLPRSKQTEHLLKAIANPLVNIIAHPTGRLIQEREAYDVDMLKIIRAAKKAGVHLELNAHPERLDLLDTHCRMAKEAGVLVAVSSDAHSTSDLANLRFGIGQARRGWLEKGDVLNTRTVMQLRPLLKRSSAR